jgi:TonB family protein
MRYLPAGAITRPTRCPRAQILTLTIAFVVATSAAVALPQDPQQQEEEVPSELRRTAIQMGAPGLVAPKMIERQLPRYTDEAVRQGIEGDAYIEAVVTVDGAVAEPVLVRSVGDDELDRRALDAIATWKFEPGTSDGKPVPVIALFTVTFRIGDNSADADEESESDSRENAVQMGSSGLVAPRQLTTELPEYTAEAKDTGIEGDVYVEAVVTVDGDVVEPKLIRGLPDDELNRRALEAVIKWKFEPGTKDNKPVPVIALFTVTFRIH